MSKIVGHAHHKLRTPIIKLRGSGSASPIPRRRREVAMRKMRLPKHLPLPVIDLLLLALPAFIVPARNRLSAFRSPNAPTATQPAHRQTSTEGYGRVPLSFEANQGQADPRAKFISRGSGYTLFLTSDEAVLALRSQKPGAALSEAKGVRSQKQEGRPWSLVPGHLQRTRDSVQGTKDKGPGTNDV